jgi:thiamine-phosphate pyrophosphorylase
VTASSRRPREIPRLHVVTDDGVLADPRFSRTARAVLAAGGSGLALHLRGSGTTGRALFEAARTLSTAARDAGAVLLVNGRVDVAMAAGADGAQLPARGLPVQAARRLLGAARVIGSSVHSTDEARAVAGGADFLLAGTLFASASHPGRPAAGVAWLRELAALGPPVVGIGGIDAGRVAEVLEAGAVGVAVLGAVWSAPDPAESVHELLEIIQGRTR